MRRPEVGVTAPVLESRRPPLRKLIAFGLALGAVSWSLTAFSAFPWTASDPGAALIRIAFKHVAAFAHEGRVRSQEELEKLPRHMRPAGLPRERGGRRVETVLRVTIDGRRVLDRTYSASGLRHDGPTFAYEEIPVQPGRHALEVTLADMTAARGEGQGGPRWRLAQQVDIAPGRALLVELSEDSGLQLR